MEAHEVHGGKFQHIGGRVGLVDSARVKNKARAVVERSAFI